MILFVLAYLGGALTIVSPCILPVIPFVLARADRPFLRNGLPMLIGMTLAFAVVASFASVAGGWVISANQYGRGRRAHPARDLRLHSGLSRTGRSPDAPACAVGRAYIAIGRSREG